MMFNKGDIVTVSGYCVSYNDGTYKRIYESSYKSIDGIVLGYSFIRTGKVIATITDEYGYAVNQGGIEQITDHKVWVIEPLTHGNRYIKPIRCFDHYLEKTHGH